MLKRSANLTRFLTTEGMKSMMAQVGMVCEGHYLLNKMPFAAAKLCSEINPRVRFPEEWRDRLSVSTDLCSTPEAKSLYIM